MLDVALTNEIIAVLGILSVAILLFVFEIVRVDVVALLVLVLLAFYRRLVRHGEQWL